MSIGRTMLRQISSLTDFTWSGRHENRFPFLYHFSPVLVVCVVSNVAVSNTPSSLVVLASASKVVSGLRNTPTYCVYTFRQRSQITERDAQTSKLELNHKKLCAFLSHSLNITGENSAWYIDQWTTMLCKLSFRRTFHGHDVLQLLYFHVFFHLFLLAFFQMGLSLSHLRHSSCWY